VRQLDSPPQEQVGPIGSPPDDRELLAAAQANPAAFDRLFDRFGDPVLNYCYYRLGTWDEAEDAAQQVFSNAFAALHRFRQRNDAPGNVRSWLFTIAHHEVANRRRSLMRRLLTPLDTAAGLVDRGPSPEELAVAKDNQGRARAMLERLPRDQRRVVELRLAGLTDTEIATVLGKSPGAVRVAQSRAVARLRSFLQDEERADD
jgi:RNA polymerase sigma-70 factor (ECF subfamily)